MRHTTYIKPVVQKKQLHSKTADQRVIEDDSLSAFINKTWPDGFLVVQASERPRGAANRKVKNVMAYSQYAEVKISLRYARLARNAIDN
jgi:hypothetical protein